jgi:hypothetical protein
MIVESTHGDGGYIELQLSDSGGAGSLTGYIGDSQAIVTSGDAGDLAIRAQGDFVVSTGGATERFKVDSSGKVGIGTAGATSYTPLTVETASGSAFAAGGVNGVGLLLRNKSSTVGTSSGIKWAANSSYHDLGGIHMVLTGNSSTNETADLTFFTSNSGDSGNTEKMRIDSAGKVGIGTTAPGYQLDLRRNDTGTTTSLGIRQLGSGDASMAFQTTTDPYGFCIGVDGSDSDAFKIATGTTDVGTNTKMTITTAGNANFAGDVDMGRIKGNVAKSNAYMRSVTRGAGNSTETFTPTHLGFTDNCQALIYVQVLGVDATSSHYFSTGAILCHITMPRGGGNTTPHIIMSASEGSKGSGVSNFSVASSGNNFVVTKDSDLGCSITIIGGGGYNILSAG